MKDDYLWDGSGEPDLEVVRLERALRTAAYREEADRPVDLPIQAKARRRWVGPAMALGALAAAAAALLVWRGDRSSGSAAPETASTGLPIRRLAGSPLVGDVSGGALLRPGQWLVTDRASSALIELGGIGQVEVGPESRVRLVGSGPAEHRLELRRGALHATVVAPPRLFLVDLPSATAVDLGCEYELAVDSSGAGFLRVATGEVSLEGHGRASLVPAGAVCETRPGRGPGTPYRAGAGADLVNALRRLDFEDGGRTALDAALAAATAADTLSLWHLVRRSAGADRARAIDRLASIAPPPPGIRMDDPAGLGDDELETWRDALEGRW